jgi:hypothetical protein
VGFKSYNVGTLFFCNSIASFSIVEQQWYQWVPTVVQQWDLDVRSFSEDTVSQLCFKITVQEWPDVQHYHWMRLVQERANRDTNMNQDWISATTFTLCGLNNTSGM